MNNPIKVLILSLLRKKSVPATQKVLNERPAVCIRSDGSKYLIEKTKYRTEPTDFKSLYYWPSLATKCLPYKINSLDINIVPDSLLGAMKICVDGPNKTVTLEQTDSKSIILDING